MLAWLDAKFNVVTPDTIAEAQDKMDVPFVDNGVLTILQYIDQHHVIPHQVAATNGGAYPQTTKVRKLIVGLTQCGLFAETLSFYRRTYKTTITQTFELLCEMIEEDEPSRASKKTSAGTGLINEATIVEHPFVKNLLEKIDSMQNAIVILSANAAAQQTHHQPADQQTSKKSSTRVPSAPSVQSAAKNSGRTKEKAFYCWTHGPNNSHSSLDCEWRSHGHEERATYHNKMGGALVPTRPTKK
jgi:hypothetical protein